MITPQARSESYRNGKHQTKEKIERKEIYVKLDHYIEKMLKHANSMHDAFKEYCKAAKEGGLTSNEAWRYIYAKLKNQIPKSTLYDFFILILPL